MFRHARTLLAATVVAGSFPPPLPAAGLGTAAVHAVFELVFAGPPLNAADDPVVTTDFWIDFRHESGAPVIRVHGFWDGPADDATGASVWRVRFTPTQPGRWLLHDVHSTRRELNKRHEGGFITAAPSPAHGFWLAASSAGGRWFQRSDGSRQYIIGNTHYDFLSRPRGQEATAASIAADVAASSRHFDKLRFGLFAFRPENRSDRLKPFLDTDGRQTDVQTDVPNPRFFRERVDVAVRTAYDADLIADLILGGTTGDQYARRPGFLKYVAARYGAYPNVWYTIGQEFNEQTDTATQQRIGQLLGGWLPYANPVSTHATAGWDPTLTGNWHTHSIRQLKASELAKAADAIAIDYRNNGAKPVLNDENGYDPGEASTADVVEGILGTFAGGGYGTTGHKTASKEGGYYWGHAALGRTIDEHPSAEPLGFLRRKIDEHLQFWRLVPRGPPASTIFASAPSGFRVLEWTGWQYVLCSNAAAGPITIELPEGEWKVVQIDIFARSERLLAARAGGRHTFSTPGSRAAMTLLLRTDAHPPPEVITAAIRRDSAAPPATNLVASTAPANTTRAPRITTVSDDLAPGVVGHSYTDDLEAEHGTAPLTWSLVKGRLPPGLAIAGSEITGQPQTAGVFRFTVRVTDRNCGSDECPLRIIVRPASAR